MTMSI